MIRFLRNAEIDRFKWDACVLKSKPGLIYPMSWYLDLVSPGWCALEKDDYSMIMPLPVKKKYRIPYIIQPLYAQQLGIFSVNKSKSENTQKFIDSVPAEFRYIALNFNSENEIPLNAGILKSCNNFELHLKPVYETISKAYSENTRRNIRKAAPFKILFEGKPEDLVKMKQENTKGNRKRIPPVWLKKYLSSVIAREKGIICTAILNTEICAAVFFILDGKRIYYLIPVSNPKGKEKKAMFAIIDTVIQRFAGRDVILDFEGSNIPGLARFFAGFGAENNPYTSVNIKKLPFPFNQFIKS